VCDLETSRIGAPYIYNVRLLRVKQYSEVSKVCNTFCIEKGYGRRRTQYALCDSFIGCSQPVTNIGQGDGAGCTLGFSVTWIGAFGVTICMRISCAINGFTFLQENT